MIRIDSAADYPKLDGVHPLAAQHIQKACDDLMRMYNLTDMSEIGCTFYLDSQADIDNHLEMGLSQPMEKSINEVADVLVLKGRRDTIRLIYAVYILNDSWGIAVYMPEDLPSDTLKTKLFEEYDGREKIIEMEAADD